MWCLVRTAYLDDLRQRVVALDRKLNALLAKASVEMATVQEIKDKADQVLADVQAESEKDDAIIALVQGQTAMITDLKQQLADAIAANDPAALQAVLDQLTAAESTSLANAQKVVDAVNANTTT